MKVNLAVSYTVSKPNVHLEDQTISLASTELLATTTGELYVIIIYFSLATICELL